MNPQGLHGIVITCYTMDRQKVVLHSDQYKFKAVVAEEGRLDGVFLVEHCPLCCERHEIVVIGE